MRRLRYEGSPSHPDQDHRSVLLKVDQVRQELDQRFIVVGARTQLEYEVGVTRVLDERQRCVQESLMRAAEVEQLAVAAEAERAEIIAAAHAEARAIRARAEKQADGLLVRARANARGGGDPLHLARVDEIVPPKQHSLRISA